MKLYEAARTIRQNDSERAERDCLALMLSPDIMRVQMFYLRPGAGLGRGESLGCCHWIIVAHVREYREIN